MARRADPTAAGEELETLPDCLLCGAARAAFEPITTRGDRFAGERAVLCSRCGLVFLDPRLTRPALERYYRSDTFSREVRGGGEPSSAALAYRDMRAQRRWRLLGGTLPAGGRCLEVGCGAGNFLRILQDAGYDVVGIDPSTGYASYARAHGLDVTAGTFPEDLRAEGTFDLVFMFHVLEHVPDPLLMLRQVRARMAPAGRFVLEYPDVALAARRRFLPPSYFERQHLFDFSEHTLGAFLARAGLAVVRVFREERRRPYDRNVLLVCEPVAPTVRQAWSPAQAERLARALRRRLRVSTPLLPLQPIWKRLKGLAAWRKPSPSST